MQELCKTLPTGPLCKYMNIKNNKHHLRIWAKNERKKCSCDLGLIEKLVETDEYRAANHIMLFYPMKDEVNLLPLLNDKTKKFYLPKIDGKTLLCCPYSGEDELCLSRFNTQEPATNPVNPNLIDLIIVPALAVDINNYRLGYGGGFYDRFLCDKKAVKVVCIPKELVVASINPDKYDIPVDIVITA